jgi:hypothetical protein
MDTDISEEEKTGEVWEKTDKVTTSSEFDLPTFAGEKRVNEKWEGRGANVIGDKQSGGYSWTKGGISSEEIARRTKNR